MISLIARDCRMLMGVQCRIEIVGPNAPILLDECFALVAELERKWSRFRSDSDISRLNNSPGRPVRVDPRTVTLVAMMKSAMHETGGTFNPTHLPDQIALGDARSLVGDHVTSIPGDAAPWESLGAVTIDPDGLVSLPPTLTLDAGGIGKGLAADIAAGHALDRGATAVCVNLGGDIRIANAHGSTHDWAIDVQAPNGTDAPLSTVSIRNGAIATSARSARRRGTRGIADHIHGSRPDIETASVIASTAAWAEVWAKHLAIADRGLADVESRGLAGLVLFTDGTMTNGQQWKDFERC